jgi:mRNA-degrading endonuclease toxin of MazEF toxin-antitoxin module
MKRGQIYFIAGPNRLGAEDHKFSRPAVIVSADAVIDDHDTVQVVYLTTHPWADLPTHATIHATGVTSTALCERVSCVDKTKLGDLCGACTDAEMAAIDRALMLALGLTVDINATAEPLICMEGMEGMQGSIERVEGERDAYKAILEKVLAR